MKLQGILARLVEHKVRFSVIGGVALVARGVPRSTEDLDIGYARDRDNLRRLADALAPIRPRLRGVPADLPFVLDEVSLRNGLNFTLDTEEGPIDLLGEVPGLGSFEGVEQASSEMQIANTRVLVLTVDGLELAKRAAGRPKDLVDLGYLRALKG